MAESRIILSVADFTQIPNPAAGQFAIAIDILDNIPKKKDSAGVITPLGGSSVESYVDLAGFPVTGKDDTVYIAEDTNYIYRWDGMAYVEISASASPDVIYVDNYSALLLLTGDTTKLYVTINDELFIDGPNTFQKLANSAYRWDGSAYVDVAQQVSFEYAGLDLWNASGLVSNLNILYRGTDSAGNETWFQGGGGMDTFSEITPITPFEFSNGGPGGAKTSALQINSGSSVDFNVNNSVAMAGGTVNAGADNSVAFGQTAIADNTNSFAALGGQASGSDSAAIGGTGTTTDSAATNSVALSGGQTNGPNSLAASGGSANSDSSTAVSGANASNFYAFAANQGSSADGVNSTAVATGNISVAATNSFAAAAGSVVFGNTAAGLAGGSAGSNEAFAASGGSQANGTASAAVAGGETTNDAESQFAANPGSIARGQNSTALAGGQTDALASNSVALGQVTAIQPDTTYVDKLNISNVAPGTPITTLGLDADGLVVEADVPLIYDAVIPAAQAQTLFSSPVSLITAPGLGKLILPMSPLTVTRLAGTVEFNHANLHGFVNFGVVYDVTMPAASANAPYPIDTFWLSDSGFTKRTALFEQTLATGLGVISDFENKPLFLACAAGDATQGDCDVRIRFEYKIIDV